MKVKSKFSRPFHPRLAVPSLKNTGCLSVAFLAAAMGWTATPLRAADATWAAVSTSGAWVTGGNWSPAAAPGNTTIGVTPSTDTATFNTPVSGGFGSSTVNPIVIDSGRTILNINYGTAAGSYFLGTTGGSTLNLSSGGVIKNSTGTTLAQVIAAPLKIFGTDATYNFTSDSTTSAATLIFQGGISGGTAGATVLTLNGSNTGANLVTGIVSNGASTTLGLAKSGTGSWTLSGANTFTGGVTLTTGNLNINNATALGGAAGTFSIGGGTTFNNGTGATLVMTQNNAQTWNGNFTFTGTNSMTFGTGAVTLAANTAVTTTANTLTENGAIGGAFALTKSGAGTLVLNGTNSYSGGTTITAGTLTLTGANASQGAVLLTAGTLNINNANALGNGTLTITSGTINNSTASAITLIGNNAQTWNGNFTYTGTQALNLGTGAVTLGANVTTTVSGSGVNGAGALTAGGNISGAKSLTKAGSGTLILGGNNTYSGGTTINAGVLQFNAANSIGGAGNNLTVNYGSTAAFGYALDQSTLTSRLVANSRATVALAADSSNNLDFAAAGLTNLSLGASTGSWTYSGSLWTPAGGIYRLGGGGGTLIFNPTLTGSNSLLVGGGGSGGAVTLVNAGTYSGGTTVTGTVGAGSAAFGSAGGGSILQSNVLAGTSTTPFGGNAAITLNNGALGLGTAGALTSGQVVTASGYNVTYSGQNAINLSAGAGNVNFAANTLNRTNRGVLLLNPTSGSTLGTTEKVTVGTGAPIATNGMVAPNYIDGTTHNFLTYDATNGFQDAAFTKTTMSTAGATDIVSLNGTTASTPFGGNRVIYALKISNNTTFNANVIGEVNETLTILSGGLILESIGANSGYNFSSDHTRASVNFGTAEAMIGTFMTAGATDSQSGVWMGTGGLTSYGNGVLAINGIGITGGITSAGGILRTLSNGAFNVTNSLTVDRAGVFQFGANGQSNQFVSLAGEGLINAPGISDGLVIDGMVNSALSTTFGGIIQDGISLTKSGLSTQILTGANIYTGSTAVNGGTLRLDFSAAGAPANNIINNSTNTSALSLGGGKLDIVGSATAANSQQFNGLTVNAGNSAIAVTSGGGGTPTVTLGATLTRNAGGTLNVTDATGGHISTIATTTLTNGVLSASASNPTAYATVNGTDWATVSSGAINKLSSYATGTGNYTTTNNVDVTDLDSVSGVTVNTLRFNAATDALTLAGTNTINTGGILVTAASTASITGGTLKSNAGNELVIINNGALTVGSVLANGAAASALTLSGSGTTTLNGSNTFTGAAYVNSGTVIIGNANAFGTAGTVNLNGGSLQANAALTVGRAISLNNNTIIGGSNDLTLSGTFTNNRNYNILTVNNSANTLLSGGVVLTASNLTVAGSGALATSGVVSGTGNLNYAGSNVLTLSGAASTYTGVTKVSSGTISVASLANGGTNSGIGASTNAATNLVLDGGTFQYTGSGASTDRLFSVGASSGTIDASGTGALNFSNTGAMAFANTPGIRSLTLTGSNTGANNLSAIIGDHLGLYATTLNKTGAGSWTLAGTNTYTGGTNVTGGTLNVTGSLADTGAVNVNGGTYTVSNSDTVGAVNLASGTINGTGTLTGSSYAIQSGTVSTVLAGTAAVTKTTSGTATLSGINTYSGATNVNGGTLIVNGYIDGASVVTVANTATLGGSGTIDANTTIQSGGTLSPGNSPGLLTENGNLTFETGSSFKFELAADTATGRGTSFDGVDVSGSGFLTIQSGVTFNLAMNVGSVDYSSSFWDSNQSWTVFSNANAADTVAGIFTLGSISNDSLGASFAITGGSFDFITSGNDILLNYTAVPEPSTYALLGLGLGALWVLRCRKSRIS